MGPAPLLGTLTRALHYTALHTYMRLNLSRIVSNYIMISIKLLGLLTGIQLGPRPYFSMQLTYFGLAVCKIR